MRLPGCTAMLEDFAPGATVKWPFGCDELHYILSGKAEVKYRLIYDLYHTEKTMTVERGDVYLVPAGATVEWKVDDSGPLQKFCVLFPGLPVGELPSEIISHPVDYSLG